MGARESRPARRLGITSKRTERDIMWMPGTELDANVVASVEEYSPPIVDTPAATKELAHHPVAAEVESLACEAGCQQAPRRQALARCTIVGRRIAELRSTRAQLLQQRGEVWATIARCTMALDSSEESSQTSEEDFDNTSEYPDDAKKEHLKQDHPTYEELLEQEEELEDEVTSLRETLGEAGAMIAGIVQKSQNLSEHLEDVVASQSGRDSASDTGSDDASEMQVFSLKLKPQDSKQLPPFLFRSVPTPLRFSTALKQGGSTASSSTATPRSENSPPESRMVSPRLEPGCEIEV